VKDIPEIAAALAAFIADPEPYAVFSNPPLDLRTIAAEVQLLPVVLDMGGCFGLRPSGEVASFTWDEPHLLRAETDVRIRNMTYYQASLKYPALAPMVPCRPADVVVCSNCGGTGRWGIGTELENRVICKCGGLGWLPKESAPGTS
jgi:hypothetical protein